MIRNIIYVIFNEYLCNNFVVLSQTIKLKNYAKRNLHRTKA